MVRGVVRRLTFWASRIRNGNPPKWSPWRCERKTVSTSLGSTPNLRMAISADAPQSIRNFEEEAETWKHVLNRPPEPKASPQPRTCNLISLLRKLRRVLADHHRELCAMGPPSIPSMPPAEACAGLAASSPVSTFESLKSRYAVRSGPAIVSLRRRPFVVVESGWHVQMFPLLGPPSIVEVKASLKQLRRLMSLAISSSSRRTPQRP
jgi:hypothetical protein